MAAWEQVVKTRVGEHRMNNHDWPDLWPQLKPIVNWLAAGLGLGSAIGAVNLLVGVLSSFWLAIQCYNWFFYTRPRNMLELEALRKSVALKQQQPEQDND